MAEQKVIVITGTSSGSARRPLCNSRRQDISFTGARAVRVYPPFPTSSAALWMYPMTPLLPAS